VRPWNDPRKDIRRKLSVQPDEHRGWVNYLAVAGKCRRRGFGRMLTERVEEQLKAMGCPKLNMQVRTSNAGVQAFYERLGYARDQTISLGKRLIADD
jgi:ribosomal protein S18 acetylase RimI-like enzyme